MKSAQRHRMIHTGLAVAMLLLAGCASLRSHWPFAHHGASPPAVVELEVGLPQAGTAPVVLQYWQRNTLVVDLTNVAADGRITLRPGAGRNWPARIAFRMAPLRFEELEVRGAQRLLLPVAAGSTDPMTAELPPGLYGAGTRELVVSWGKAGSF